MKHKLHFFSMLLCFATIAAQAQINFASRANITFKNDNGTVINAVGESAEAFYNRTDNRLKIRLDIDRIVTEDSLLTASFRNLGLQWIIFEGTVSRPDRFFEPNNVSNYPVENGVWWYSQNSLPAEATYTTQTFIEQSQERSRTRLNFLSTFDPTMLQIPIVSDIASFELTVSLPDAYVNLVTVW